MAHFEEPLINKAEAIARLGDDESLFAEMANMFVADSETYCVALENARASADVVALRREAHTVKSLLATFSFEAGRSLAMQLEHLAAAGSLEGADELTADVIDAIRCLSVELTKELG